MSGASGAGPTGSTPVERDVFVTALRTSASGVAVVVVLHDGRPWGLTVSSFTSLSAAPPQVTVSVRTDTVTAKEILTQGRFGVSLLTDQQRDVALAAAAPGIPKFIDDWVVANASSPVPAVAGALAHLDCELVQSIRVADHEIVVGLVVGTALAQPANGPLVHFEREFWPLAPAPIG